MRELSVEQKAKAYDEALKWMCDLYPNLGIAAKEKAESIFPELSGSENEKIRKTLKHYLEVRRCQTRSDEEYINCNNFLAWLEKQGTSYTKKDVDDAFVEGMVFAKDELEKQGEQKPTCLLDNSESNVKFPFKAKVKSNGKIVTIHGGQLSMDCKEWIKYQSDAEDRYTVYNPNNLELVCEIDQNPAWSEEDEVKINRIVACLENLNVADNDILLKDVDWLKSLKERYTCKPSDEQMRALEYIINNAHNTSYSCKIAKELLEQLRKLKGEEV